MSDPCEVKRIHKTIDIFSLPEASELPAPIKITYFNLKALAEPIRMLLKYGNVEFEDARFEREKWPEIKEKMPFGQVPVYEEDGRIAHQSLAIARYVAKKVKLIGGTDWENLEIDSVVDTINDLRKKIATYDHEKDDAVKERCKGKLFKETIPFYLCRLDKIAKDNKGHLAIGRLTWADVFFVGVLDCLNYMTEMDLTETHQNLRAVRDNVLDLPAIKSWVETRPKTDL